MSFGKNLTIAFGAMFLATMSVGAAAWTGIVTCKRRWTARRKRTGNALKVISSATTNVAEPRS